MSKGEKTIHHRSPSQSLVKEEFVATDNAKALEALIEAVDAGEIRAYEKSTDRNGFATENMTQEFCDILPAGFFEGWQFFTIGRAYEGSLDAAVALKDALLPGWEWGRLVSHGTMIVATKSGQFHSFNSDNSIPARALLLAVLKAYRQTLREGE